MSTRPEIKESIEKGELFTRFKEEIDEPLLVHAEEIMQDDLTLEDYNVSEESLIEIV